MIEIPMKIPGIATQPGKHVGLSLTEGYLRRRCGWQFGPSGLVPNHGDAYCAASASASICLQGGGDHGMPNFGAC